MNEIYNIVIVGSGPAGSYLSGLLKPSIGKVLILDKRIDNEALIKTEKPCSGLVAVPAQKYLADMISENRNNILATPSILKIRIIDTYTKRQVTQNQEVFNINRIQMEQQLISEIPDHIEILYETTFISYQEREDGLKEVIISHKNNTIKLITRTLVGADGANSKIRKKIFVKDEIPKYTGIEWIIKNPKNDISAHFNIILDPNLTDYYLWAFPKNDTLLIGGVFKNISDPKVIPPRLINHLKDIGILENSPDITDFWFWAHPILRPLKRNHLIQNTKNVYLIGESAGFICPTSAEGYSYAFSSAQELSKELNSEVIKKFTDKKNISRILKKQVRKNLIYNRYIRGFFFILFGKRY